MMNPKLMQRLKKDHAEILTNKNIDILCIYAEPKKESIINKEGMIEYIDVLMDWSGYILGPDETPFQGGKFNINIIFPNDYPFLPPLITFETKIYHPNISRNGTICIDILKDKWSPALSLTKILLSISSLLAEPNGNDPLEIDIANMYLNNNEKYIEKAKSWTVKYASH